MNRISRSARETKMCKKELEEKICKVIRTGSLENETLMDCSKLLLNADEACWSNGGRR